MTSIKLTVTGAQARASVTGPLTSGMVGIPVAIEYDEAWDGLTKNLMCRCSPWGSSDGESRAILHVGETASVAHEVMQADMYLYLGVEGFNDDGTLVMPTTWACCGKIAYGANTCEDPSTDPSLSVWNQLQTEMEQLQEQTLTQEQAAQIQAYAQEAREAAEEAKEAAANAGSGSGSGSGQNAGAATGYGAPTAETVGVVGGLYLDTDAHALYMCVGVPEDGGDDVHTHSYTAAVTTAATCTTAGVKTYTCSCGDSYTEAIPATGHSYVDGVCSVCGAADPDYNPDAVITGITATYSGGDVVVGTELSALTGIIVTATYDDGSTAAVSGYSLSGEIVEGENTITAAYEGMTATFTVVGVTAGDGGTAENVTVELTELGYWYISGSKILSQYGKNSGEISLDGYSQIITHNCSCASAGYVVAYFDADGNLMSDVSVVGRGNNLQTDYTFDIPDGAATAIISDVDSSSTANVCDGWAELVPAASAASVMMLSAEDDGVAVATETSGYVWEPVVPVATSTRLGGVMPVTATTAMTQAVGVTADGRLVTAPTATASTGSKKVLTIGDSITSLDGDKAWQTHMVNLTGWTYQRVSKSGAYWKNFADTTEGTDLTLDAYGHGNTICNHINIIKAKCDPESELYDESYTNFDAVVVFAGHNDLSPSTSEYDEDAQILSQFVSEQTVENEDGTTTTEDALVALENVDKTTWGGAMRYTYESLRELYPDAVIFFMAPIQSGTVGQTSYRGYSAIKAKGRLIDLFCQRVGGDVVFIDTIRCGINTIYETVGSEGRDLYDGLHPNASGAAKIAAEAVRVMRQFLS